MTKLSSTSEKIKALRGAMKEAGVEGFIVPRADEYQGEFVAPYAERLKWLTDFTGSAGVACVLADKAVVLSDARYTIQLDQQVDDDVFETGNVADLSLKKWLEQNAHKGAVIGYDSWLHPPEQIKRLKSEGYTLKALEHNLVDQVWQDQPEPPNTSVMAFPNEIAGMATAEKLGIIQAEMQKSDLKACVLTLPDSIAWLLNIRAQDTDYIPLALSYAVVHADDARIDWFINPDRVKDLGFGDVQVNIVSPDDLGSAMKALSGRVGIDQSYTPIWFSQILGDQAKPFKDPCIAPKAIKTAPEQDAIRKAHIHDGVGQVKFLKWLSENENSALTELSVAQKLRAFREEYDGFKGSSFPTICGFGANGAIVHYRATQENNAAIDGAGLLLVDSGGQYAKGDVYGTTDITRTIAIGKPSDEMKRAFTLVLKGHIAVDSAIFPEGTTGAQIDALARYPLWQERMDFAHGTGHGVGCYLAVHEDAANLSPRGDKALKPGMLLSNEPGYYKEGAFGIRIENLVLVKDIDAKNENGKALYGFETVSFAPIDMRCIDMGLLSEAEKKWLSDYHDDVLDKLSPHLDADHKAWLEQVIRS